MYCKKINHACIGNFPWVICGNAAKYIVKTGSKMVQDNGKDLDNLGDQNAVTVGKDLVRPRLKT